MKENVASHGVCCLVLFVFCILVEVPKMNGLPGDVDSVDVGVNFHKSTCIATGAGFRSGITSRRVRKVNVLRALS